MNLNTRASLNTNVNLMPIKLFSLPIQSKICSLPRFHKILHHPRLFMFSNLPCLLTLSSLLTPSSLSSLLTLQTVKPEPNPELLPVVAEFLPASPQSHRWGVVEPPPVARQISPFKETSTTESFHPPQHHLQLPESSASATKSLVFTESSAFATDSSVFTESSVSSTA